VLQLFHSIFGSGRDAAPYRDELIQRAIERAVDGTDPRLRVLPGYAKKLRSAVTHAVDHVVALVDKLPAPLELDRTKFAADSELIAYFASVTHAQELLAVDPTLNQWLAAPDNAASEHIVMLLLMEQQERHVHGVALEGEILRRDVAQTTVSFAQYRLIDPAAAEETTRQLLKRRAFDHLLALALERITAAHAERDELERERQPLRRKQAALAAGRWAFDDTGSGTPPDPQVLQQQLEEIESQLQTLGAGPKLLTAHLDIVVDVLAQAEHNFWLERRPLIVDRMGIQQTQASALAPQIELTLLRNAAGHSLVARLVGIARADLPPRRDLLREAQRSLG
jgi:hypothetical protein